ncbi:unnamed protein product [Toxocara canis]|uniref:RMI1_C domain-containing protein n=1 Tax=Toxocara canis TaxID=6265 RepID=A0A183VDR6_TOXCA|nr:unnamed protein product [Toxocara canis]
MTFAYWLKASSDTFFRRITNVFAGYHLPGGSDAINVFAGCRRTEYQEGEGQCMIQTFMQQHPWNTLGIRDGSDNTVGELSHENLLQLDDRSALATPAAIRPSTDGQPMQNTMHFGQQISDIGRHLPLTCRKRPLEEQRPSNETVSVATAQHGALFESVPQTPSNASEVLMIETEGCGVGNSSSKDRTTASRRPFILFHTRTVRQGRIDSCDNDHDIVARFVRLQITTLAEVHRRCVFWMIAQRKRIQPISCEVVGSLQVSRDGWLVNVLVTDHTARDLFCTIENDLLERLLGFSFKECRQLCATKEVKRLLRYKRRASMVLHVFSRLDLVLTIEFSPSSDIVPLIVDITNLASALDMC